MLSDTDLLEILNSGGDVPVAYFDNQRISVNNDKLDPNKALIVLKNFLTLSTDHRTQDTRHLYAYYKYTFQTAQEYVLEDMDGVVPTIDEIWDHVTPTLIYFDHLDAGKYVKVPTTFLMLEGQVAWEIEHGLLMSWNDGRSLVKVGQFDGHPTNGHARANPALDKYVYYTSNESFCTRPDATK